MRILSHRGFWRVPSERNSIAAFEHSISEGFGTETDVRDLVGQLVVAHDPPSGHETAWSDIVELFDGKDLPLAVNIKSDGLSGLLAAAFEMRSIEWFAFDMSSPETVRYARAGLPYFARHSDVEPDPILYDQAQGIWLDAFNAIWFDTSVICRHLDRGKAVCVVSQELHGREHRALWDMLMPIKDAGPSLMLCTDMPDRAEQWFAR